MANRSHAQGQPNHSAPSTQPRAPAFTEPEVHRWPHPVNKVEPAAPLTAALPADSALYHIHCALAYQNQLLADIKSLLEQIAVDSAQISEEK